MTTTTAPTTSAAAPTAKAARRRGGAIRRFIPLLFIGSALGAYVAYRYVQTHRAPEWSGTVEARDVVVGSRAGGRVAQVLVREGERVEPGAPLVVLEPGDLRAQRLVAEGQLAQAQANLDRLVKGSRPEEVEQAQARAESAQAALQESLRGARAETVAQARSRLVAAQAAVDKAQADAERARQLVAAGAMSGAEADAAEAALKTTLGLRDAQQHALDELVNGVRSEDKQQAQARAKEAEAQAKLIISGPREEDIRAAQGMVDAAKGRVAQIDVLLGELTVRAPVAARVETLDLRPGDILAPNAPAVTLLEDDQLYVRVYIPETQLGLAHPQEIVRVSVDAFPDRTFEGEIEHINGVGEYTPRNLQTADERADQVFAARVGLREGADVLRAGMAAFVKVPK